VNYRPDIQILRGISVLLVVFYHLQTNFFYSGFLGVDIFFVISGFLMAVLYNRSGNPNVLDRGVLIDFFARRARRILPAYFATLFVVLGISYFLLLPPEFRSLSNHTLYTALLIPNVGYWFEDNYFDVANFRPLLHLWSLGVEVQFYLIVPLVVAIFSRSKKLLIAMTLLSFVGCLILNGRSPNTAFFQLPARFWEFMIGFLCAQLFTNQGNVRRPMGWVSVSATILIIVIASIDYEGIVRHPGFAAALACLLTATVLVFGLPASFARSPLGRLAEKTGQYSYSIYLVHFPIILLLKYEPFAGSRYAVEPGWELLLVLTLITVASIAMYHLIESPLRHRKHRLSQLAPLLACITLAIAAAPLLKQHQRSSYSQEQLSIFDSVHDKITFRCGVFYELIAPVARSCSLTSGDHDSSLRFLLLGNSHADAIKTELAETARKHGHALRIWKDNFPLGMAKTTPDNVSAEAMKHDIDVVIIHNSPGYFDRADTQELVALAEKNGFRVVLIDPVPTWSRSIPLIAWNEKFGDGIPEQQHINDHYNKVSGDLAAIASINGDAFSRFEVADYFCKPMCQKVDRSGVPIYFDSHHLNLRGTKILTPVFEKIFQM